MSDMRKSGIIIEGLVTTIDADGTPRIAAMGPVVRGDYASFVLRPFTESRTFDNLARTRAGVFHVTDDVEILARAVVGAWDRFPEFISAESIEGRVMADCCRAFEFRVTRTDMDGTRARFECAVEGRHRFRDFVGWNRAHHAVVEGAILATRLTYIAPDRIARAFEEFARLVDKTGGEREHRAFRLLADYVAGNGRSVGGSPRHS